MEKFMQGEDSTIIVIPFDTDTHLEIFEMEAVPILKGKYEFDYKKEIEKDRTVVIIASNTGGDPSFPHEIIELMLKLLKGIKSNE